VERCGGRSSDIDEGTSDVAITEPTEGRLVHDQDAAAGDGQPAVPAAAPASSPAPARDAEVAPLELVTRVAGQLSRAMNSVIEG
jgi:hypothetical protein